MIIFTIFSKSGGIKTNYSVNAISFVLDVSETPYKALVSSMPAAPSISGGGGGAESSDGVFFERSLPPLPVSKCPPRQPFSRRRGQSETPANARSKSDEAPRPGSGGSGRRPLQ